MYYWYSDNQAGLYRSNNFYKDNKIPMNYAVIKDKVLLYTACSETKEYIGEGKYSHSEGYW